MSLQKTVSIFCGLLFISLTSGCKAKQLQLNGNTMGTYYSIKYLAESSGPDSVNLRKEVDRRLELVNQQMSTYRSDSEISLFNASQEVNTLFPVSNATAKVVNEAIRIAGLTDNALDITIGPLVNLWGFGPQTDRDTLVPSPDEIKQRLEETGIDKLKVQGSALIKTVPRLYVDLSSIAKGYGVDVVAEYLESEGINNYLVDIGGEVRAKGKNYQGRTWRIAIEKPVAGVARSVQQIIELNDISIATSGNYRNYFDFDGVHYSHTIDPKTGYPIQNGIASITVIAPSCMTADGFATGLGVLGANRAMEIADRINLAVFIVEKTDNGFVERYSKAFNKYRIDK